MFDLEKSTKIRRAHIDAMASEKGENYAQALTDAAILISGVTLLAKSSAHPQADDLAASVISFAIDAVCQANGIIDGDECVVVCESAYKLLDDINTNGIVSTH